MDELIITEAALKESEDKYTAIEGIPHKQLEEQQHEKGAFKKELSEEVKRHKQEFLESERERERGERKRNQNLAPSDQLQELRQAQQSAENLRELEEKLRKDQEEDEDVKQEHISKQDKREQVRQSGKEKSVFISDGWSWVNHFPSLKKNNIQFPSFNHLKEKRSEWNENKESSLDAAWENSHFLMTQKPDSMFLYHACLQMVLDKPLTAISSIISAFNAKD